MGSMGFYYRDIQGSSQRQGDLSGGHHWGHQGDGASGVRTASMGRSGAILIAAQVSKGGEEG